MSTELYFSVEARDAGSGRWWHFARVRVSQDYLLFALLARVRVDDANASTLACLAPRGLPDDVTELTLEEDALAVDDEAAALEVPDTCQRTRAEEWVASGLSRFLRDGSAVTHPELHSHSWLSRDDLAVVLERYTAAQGRDMPFLRSILAAMEVLHASAIDSRAVFWFGG